jgi:glycerol kinase
VNRRFEPLLSDEKREHKLRRWRSAVERARSWVEIA